MSMFTSRFADRGKVAETAVQKYLTRWAAALPKREFNRLADTKAAGRIIKAAPADFDFYAEGNFGLIEVKETKHDYRLERSKVSQLPRLRLRASAGGLCLVLVLHSTLNKWRALLVQELTSFGDKGSWNLTDRPLFDNCDDALASAWQGFRHEI